MNRFKTLALAGVMIMLLISASIWWSNSKSGDPNDPLNMPYAFVYKGGNGDFYWFDITKRSGKVKGKFHQLNVVEEKSSIKETAYPVTGKKTGKGYEIKISFKGKKQRSDVHFSGKNLLVKEKQGKFERLYRAVDKKEFDRVIENFQDEAKRANYNEEQFFNHHLDTFFSELDRTFGYLYARKNESLQLLLKIDEWTREGDVSGSLLVSTRSDNKKPYEETKYEVVGITDGSILQLYTKVDGKETRLIGHFHGNASKLELSFWKTKHRLIYRAVTEEEFNKIKAQR
ncbi:hypothetical protein [Bacillus massilinigeriensis]|uniref:hypothetical protein n=1 Tax=Bacillus mediterraneensis TaxID=1805474 RepID=UPI0008F90395|nr:hypothetical protein [Bacillus mediterraneensis]